MEKFNKIVNWLASNLGMIVSIIIGLILAWVLSPVLEFVGWTILAVALCIVVYSALRTLAAKNNWTWF